MLKRTTVGLCLALALAGCAGTTLPPAPKTPDQALYEAEASLDVAVKAMVTYAQLPRCGTGPAVCAVQGTVVALYNTAHDARVAIATAKTLIAAYNATTAAVGDASKVQDAVNAAEAAVQQAIGAAKLVKGS